jgi:hypothetical protein
MGSLHANDFGHDAGKQPNSSSPLIQSQWPIRKIIKNKIWFY